LAFSYWTIKPWFLTEEKFATVLIIPSSRGSQLGGYLPASSIIFWRHCQGKRRLLQGEFRPHILYFVLSFALLYFYLHRFYQKTKKLVSFIVVFACLLLALLEWLLMRTTSCVISLALIIVILSALLLRHLLLLQIYKRLSLLC
jgi:hypothetical protein